MFQCQRSFSRCHIAVPRCHHRAHPLSQRCAQGEHTASSSDSPSSCANLAFISNIFLRLLQQRSRTVFATSWQEQACKVEDVPSALRHYREFLHAPRLFYEWKHGFSISRRPNHGPDRAIPSNDFIESFAKRGLLSPRYSRQESKPIPIQPSLLEPVKILAGHGSAQDRGDVAWMTSLALWYGIKLCFRTTAEIRWESRRERVVCEL